MNFEEHTGKAVLRAAGVATPEGRLCDTPATARSAAEAFGTCAVKAQVATGKRGKAGGIRIARSPEEAEQAAADILGMEIGGYTVHRVLVEQGVDIRQELYAAVLNDPATKGPLVLVSAEGGMEIEELAAEKPESLIRVPVDIRHGVSRTALEQALAGTFTGDQLPALLDTLERLYAAYAGSDADLLEINPLVVTGEGGMLALDCKLSIDDGAVPRQPDLAAEAPEVPMTELERRARELSLPYIQLDGSVGILANGAGLTMTTMDVVSHYGGAPANFLEIGGEAYTKGRDALRLVLDNPNVRSLVINFCGAFARTDVMTEGVLAAWDEVRPQVPVHFCINGTGEDEALAMVRDKLGVTPTQVMDEAVQAAVEAAR
ncbi:succinate--CoA ligase subunit beta [Spiribacter halobius]|uniref:Succinate--CoA ligase n=1 Tax=Sediminicurvatus halobius TaxID=2182432 RepID=A0A2U2N5S6_9GAMM|nr:ATP-grasp domain-containing protein [Spiribacter halobius]PWG64561.1 succinate--CoA ligase [Spiribacter halobius]UEX79119.1 acetate--CoA ligase family protein [Spiribacter halobius]